MITNTTTNVHVKFKCKTLLGRGYLLLTSWGRGDFYIKQGVGVCLSTSEEKNCGYQLEGGNDVYQQGEGNVVYRLEGMMFINQRGSQNPSFFTYLFQILKPKSPVILLHTLLSFKNLNAQIFFYKLYPCKLVNFITIPLY